MVTIYHFLDNDIKRLTVKELARSLPRQQGMFWIDMENPSDAEEETLLVGLLDIHPLAIEDAQRGTDEEGHLPKVENFGSYLFVIFNPVEGSHSSGGEDLAGGIEIRTTQLSAFLMKQVLVTHHYKPLRSITNAVQLCTKNPATLGRGPDFLFHLIIDDVVDNYTPLLDALDSAIDNMEAEVFKEPSQHTMQRILQLKKNIMTIRRIAMYQREMLSRLSRGEFELIARDEMAYYRNVYDHLVRMADLTDSYRDVVSGLLDAYLSVTSNKLSQVMKVLTIISTIFLPLSVITGFFGMNFEFLPWLHLEYGHTLASIFMVAVAGGMLIWFRRKKWI
ncbi:MAG: magnesium/cobalt transporter CorA [Bacteroidetes bacterium]|nr:magnesium/cobalt transporter CorA [Bacteroidota bacterium]MCW5897351.1 magnesium/cobalt transporter CorA [Bacteroidota bacterium]